MTKIVIFGTGKVAAVAADIFAEQSETEVIAFTVDRQWLNADTLNGKPVVAFEDLTTRYPPGSVSLFLAIGYHQINRLRARKHDALRALGYQTVNCISRRAWVAPSAKLGSNCLIMPNAVIEPEATVGDNVVVWSNTTIGHHSTLDDHVWISGNTVIGGAARLETRCFAALGAVVGNEVRIGAGSFLGAGTLTTRCQQKNTVIIARDTEKFRLDAEQFLKITRLR